jgi:hypothetical protein
MLKTNGNVFNFFVCVILYGSKSVLSWQEERLPLLPERPNDFWIAFTRLHCIILYERNTCPLALSTKRPIACMCCPQNTGAVCPVWYLVRQAMDQGGTLPYWHGDWLAATQDKVCLQNTNSKSPSYVSSALRGNCHPITIHTRNTTANIQT